MWLYEFAENLLLESDGEKLHTGDIFDSASACDTIGHNFRSAMQEARRRSAYMIIAGECDEKTFLDNVCDEIRHYEKSARRNRNMDERINARLMWMSWLRIHREAHKFLRDEKSRQI